MAGIAQAVATAPDLLPNRLTPFPAACKIPAPSRWTTAAWKVKLEKAASSYCSHTFKSPAQADEPRRASVWSGRRQRSGTPDLAHRFVVGKQMDREIRRPLGLDPAASPSKRGDL